MAKTTAVQALLLVACISLFISPGHCLRRMLKNDSACVDQKDDCGKWAEDGECDGDFKDFMKNSCPKSCKVPECSETTDDPIVSDYTETSDSESDREIDLSDSLSVDKEEALRMEVESEFESELEDAKDSTKPLPLADVDPIMEAEVEKEDEGEGEIDSDEVDISEYGARPLEDEDKDEDGDEDEDEDTEKEHDSSMEGIDSGSHEEGDEEESEDSDRHHDRHHHDHDHDDDDDDDDDDESKSEEGESTGCVDLTDKCKMWYEKGSCTAAIEGDFVREVCRKSCMTCNETIAEGTDSRVETESGTETEDAISESLESRKEEKEEEEQEEKEEKEEKEEQEENTESESETAEGSDEAETTETDKDECVDTDDKCEDWAKQGECDGKFSEVMGKSCPKSCGLCSGKSKSETESKTDRACEDTDERCAEWKGNGECDGKFADFMVEHCARSCDLC